MILRFSLALIVCLSAANATTAAPDDADRAAALQAYYTGNGLLNRNLFDLAAREYRTFLDALPDHENAPLARYGLAVCLFRTGKLDEAAAQLQPLSERKGFEFAAEVSVMLGQARLSAGKYEEALQCFKRVLDQHEDHALADGAAAQYIEAAHRAGRHGDAAKMHARLVKRWPDSPHRDRADYFAGLSALATGDDKTAGRSFEHVLKVSPDGPFAAHAQLLAAQCLHRLGELKSAASHYRDVLAASKNPHRAEALFGLAAVLKSSGDDAGAAPLLDEYLEKHADGPRLAEVRILRGRIFFDGGEYQEAQPLFDAAAGADGAASVEAAYWSAKCDLRREKFEQAATALERILEKAGQHSLLPEMRYDRAIALYRGEKREQAATALAEFVEKHGTHALAPQAANLRASVLHQLGQYEQSLSAGNDFLERWPGDGAAPAVRLLNVENLYFLKRYADAAKAAESFLRDEPSHVDAALVQFRLGMSRYFLGEYDAALTALSSLPESAHGDAHFAALPLAVGDIHFQQGRWEKAIKHLSAFLDSGATQAGADDATLKLGLARQRLGRHKDALAQYDRLLEQFPESQHRVQARFERGQVLIALGDLDGAARAFEEVLAAGDSRFDTPARRHLSHIAYRRGDFEDAAKRFGKLASELRGKEGEADAAYHHALALVNAAEFADAEKALSRFLDRHAGDERSATMRAHLAIVQSRRDRHADALETMEKVKSGQLSGDLRAALAYERGWCLRRTGKDEDAARVFRELLETDPPAQLRAHALLELADLETAAGNGGRAIELLESLRSLVDSTEPRLPDAVDEQTSYRLGVALYEAGRAAEAEKALGRLLRDHADSKLAVSAAMFRGEALVSLSRHSEAVPCFERVVEAGPGDSSHAAALLRLGDCHAALGDWPRSEAAFAQYLKEHADGEHWYQAEFGLGWARENQGDADAAAEHYRRVVARHQGPTAARAQFQIGQCLFAKKEYETAAAELLKVDILYAYPEWSAAALYEAGRCFEALARRAEARQQFEAVVARFKDSRWASMAGERLKQAADTGLPGRAGKGTAD